MAIAVKLTGVGSYYLKYLPIKFQDKVWKNVEAIKKNVNPFI